MKTWHRTRRLAALVGLLLLLGMGLAQVLLPGTATTTPRSRPTGPGPHVAAQEPCAAASPCALPGQSASQPGSAANPPATAPAGGTGVASATQGAAPAPGGAGTARAPVDVTMAATEPGESGLPATAGTAHSTAPGGLGLRFSAAGTDAWTPPGLLAFSAPSAAGPSDIPDDADASTDESPDAPATASPDSFNQVAGYTGVPQVTSVVPGGGVSGAARVVAVTTAVPEPQTVAMMLAGLGLLAFMSRRRLSRIRD